MRCSVCLSCIRWNQNKLVCSCGRQCHVKCSDINPGLHSISWKCNYCILSQLPFNHYVDDQEFHSTMYSFFHNIPSPNLDSYVFDAFQMNECNVSIDNIDDPCNHYFSDNFNTKFSNTNSNETFSIFHLNSRSLVSNFPSISDYISTLNHRFSIYAFTETWFKPDVPSLYNLPGYSFIHKPRRNRRGGGVCMYIDSELMYKERNDLSFSNDFIDTIFIEINQKHGKNIIVGVVYKAPNSDSSTFNELLETCVTNLAKESKLCYLVGDFNYDLLKYSSHPATGDFLSIMYENCFRPLITRPTRLTQSSYTCIDNIFTNVIDKPVTPGILFSDITDHLPIFHITKSYYTQDRHCSKTSFARTSKKVNINNLLRELHSSDWSCIENCEDPNTAYEVFINEFISKCDQHTVERNVQSMGKKYTPRKPWITKGIMSSVVQKQKLYRKHIAIPSKRNELLYKQYRNRLNRIIRARKKEYFTCLLERNKSDICKTWKVINEILGKQNSSKLPQFILKGHRKIEGDKMIANAFNSYFASIGSATSKKVDKSAKHFSNYLGSQTNKSLFFIPTDENEIIKVVKQLKNTSSVGHDDISVTFIKKIIYAIAKPLSIIFNISLSTGVVPDTLKIAKVIPIHKKGDEHTLENYRPISLLPAFSKILERIIYNRLYDHLLQNKILAKEQFGFRPFYSTELALLHTLERILTSLDNKETVIALFIDLSKAFDSLDHSILLYKLEHYGVRGVPLNWFRNYLTDRKQFTCVNGVNSSTLPLTCGVPQGSILGPLLFLIYANDIINTSNVLRFILYADDTNILFSHKNVNTLYSIMNAELIQVCDWFRANKLQMNGSKTKYMVFRSYRNTQQVLSLYSHAQIKIDNQVIDRVDSTNFLGVIIDDKLTWTKHINSIHGKISMSVGVMRKLRSFLPVSTLFTLYNALILPHLDYCSLVWSGTSLANLHRLYVLQKKAIRICSSADRLDSTAPLFKKLNSLTLSDSVSVKLGLFVYKYFNATLPNIFDNCIVLNHKLHQIETRNKNNIVIPFCRLSITQRNSIIYKSAKFWNSLDSTLKNVTTQSAFKSRCKRHFISAY